MLMLRCTPHEMGVCQGVVTAARRTSSLNYSLEAEQFTVTTPRPCSCTHSFNRGENISEHFFYYPGAAARTPPKGELATGCHPLNPVILSHRSASE